MHNLHIRFRKFAVKWINSSNLNNQNPGYINGLFCTVRLADLLNLSLFSFQIGEPSHFTLMLSCLEGTAYKNEHVLQGYNASRHVLPLGKIPACMLGAESRRNLKANASLARTSGWRNLEFPVSARDQIFTESNNASSGRTNGSSSQPSLSFKFEAADRASACALLLLVLNFSCSPCDGKGVAQTASIGQLMLSFCI